MFQRFVERAVAQTLGRPRWTNSPPAPIAVPWDRKSDHSANLPEVSQPARFYGWYSNKMRGQRSKQTVAVAKAAGKAVAVIDVSEHQSRRIPSPKWRELIKKVWEADPLLCPRCQKEMRIVALLDDRTVIERILRHLGLWQQGVRIASGPDPPGDLVSEPCFDDVFSDNDTEPDLIYAND